MVKVNCVKVKKKEAEETRKKLAEEKTLDRGYEVLKDEDNVYFPVKKDLKNFETVEKQVKEKEKKPRSLEESLEGKLTDEELESLVTSFNILGSIAVLEVPDELQKREEEIGEAIMEVHPSVSTVCKRKGKTSGKFRIRPVEVIAGEEKTETTHLEHGVKMKLNLNKTYFNPRLSHEREVIADKVTLGERIGYFFAGVGPFALVIASKNPEAKVNAFELNKGAYRYLEENIKLNKFTDRIEAVHKDVKEVEGYDFDRIIMPLPLTSEEYLESAVRNASKGSVIHYYSIGKEPEYFEKPLEELRERIDRFKVLEKREVLNYSPGKKEVVVDVKLN